jgi:hypothetical protein
LARYVKEQANRYLKDFGVWMIYRRDRYLRGGDHIPFVERGFTEAGVFYGDTPEFVDFQYTANVARVNLVTLASLARAPAKPKGVAILTTKLTNDTQLRWEPNTDADLAGYEVVWRDTTSPEWTGRQEVGPVTTYLVKGMSKDNYFFGVRSVDTSGNKSPVAFPLPVR